MEDADGISFTNKKNTFIFTIQDHLYYIGENEDE